MQALAKGDPQPGQRVLVHAGAGGIGCWAVQLAKQHFKCYVVATAGPKNQTFLTEVSRVLCCCATAASTPF